MARKIRATRNRVPKLRTSVLQAISEICTESDDGAAYWVDHDIPGRVKALMGWKRLNEHRLRQISGTIAGLVYGATIERGEGRKGNRPLWIA